MQVVNLQDDISALLQKSNQPLEHAVRELLVLELYRRGAISSGKAGQLMDMSRFEFVRFASQLGIAFFDLTEDEWQSERAQIETI